MRKTYFLKGLDCANCANGLEERIKKLEGVEFVRINFIPKKMVIEISDKRFKEKFQEVERILANSEDNIKVEEFKIENDDQENKIKLYRIILAIFLFLTSMITISYSKTGTIILYIIIYLLLGYDIFYKAFKNILKGKVFDENFLMIIAAIGATFLGEYNEAIAVLLLYQVGEYFQDYAVDKSKKSITKLMDIKPDFAYLEVDGQRKKVSPESVNINDIIIIDPGDKVPLDSIIIAGNSYLDNSALTGESLPKEVQKGDMVLSGTINKTGKLVAKVVKKYQDSTVNKILDLVENSNNTKTNSERFITRFSKIYTPIVVILAILIAVFAPIILKDSFDIWIYRAITFLVISCPCALVISVPLSFFAGIGGASKLGVLVKGSIYLERLAKMENIAFDKTGTITKGNFKIQEIKAYVGTSEQLLEYAAYAESSSSHPIANSIKEKYAKDIDEKKITNMEVLPGKGIKANFDNKIIYVGNKKILEDLKIKVNDNPVGTVVYVISDNQYMGYILIADEIKDSSKEALEKLKQVGIKKSIMLTGDNSQVANSISKDLKIDQVIANLLPEEKVQEIEKLKKENTYLGFVGDGINDAPACAMADIGMAMGGIGSDAAIEAADVVIMDDNLLKVWKVRKLSQKVMQIVWQNIIFALSIKFLFLLLGVLGYSSIGMAIFADVGVSIIAILNAMRCMYVRN